MKKTWLGCYVVLGLFVSIYSPSSNADDAFDMEVTSSLGFMSKYTWRGWEINKDPSGYGAIHIGYGGFYTGIWGGTDGTLGSEIDLYVGYGGQFNDDISYDFGYIQYRYPESDVDVQEWHLTVDFSYFNASYHRGEDNYNYVELNKSFELTDKFSFDLHAGREDTGSWTWNDYQATLNYQINDNYRAYLGATSKEDHEEYVFVGLHADF